MSQFNIGPIFQVQHFAITDQRLNTIFGRQFFHHWLDITIEHRANIPNATFYNIGPMSYCDIGPSFHIISGRYFMPISGQRRNVILGHRFI
jgi:hypothetical protein